MNILRLAAIPAIAVLTMTTAPAANSGEAPAVFRASTLLPGARLTGVNYLVKESVINDGFINHYTVVVDGGSHVVAGNALMRERLNELAALQRMEQIQRSDTYVKAVQNAGTGALKDDAHHHVRLCALLNLMQQTP